MYNPCAPMNGVPILIMDAQSVLNTLSTVLGPGVGIRNHTIDIIANASVAGVAITGSLALESADAVDALGGWNPFGGGAIDLSTIVVPAAQTKGRIQLSFSKIIIPAFRTRIAVVVGGGTVSVIYTGQP